MNVERIDDSLVSRFNSKNRFAISVVATFQSSIFNPLTLDTRCVEYYRGLHVPERR